MIVENIGLGGGLTLICPLTYSGVLGLPFADFVLVKAAEPGTLVFTLSLAICFFNVFLALFPKAEAKLSLGALVFALGKSAVTVSAGGE